MASNGRHAKTPREDGGDEHSTKKAKSVTMVEELKSCWAELIDFITKKKCGPILVRLAWHDAGTFDKDVKDWPQSGGANGSIRFAPELAHGANAGLKKAVDLLEPFAKKYPTLSYADVYQMASAAGIKVAGGPDIPLRYGRKDAEDESGCPPENRLPGAKKPFPDESETPAEHLRKIFYRMGLTDKDIVALSGAHTIGRAFKDRSGMGSESTAYTATVEDGVTQGGSSWTKEWLKFDNSYFVEIKNKKDEGLLVMETDACLFEDESFKELANKYAEDADAFYADYAASHKKLSELGVQWVNEGPITIDD